MIFTELQGSEETEMEQYVTRCAVGPQLTPTVTNASQTKWQGPTLEYLWYCTKYLRLFKHTVSRALVTIHVSNDKIYKSEITSVLIRVIYIADFWIGNILPHPWRHTPFNSTISHISLTWKSYSFEDIFYITHSYNTISLQIKSEKYRCVNWTSEVN